MFFDHDKGKTHSSGKLLYQARIIPYRGSWLDFEFDPKDLIHVRIDRRRKMPATVLLKALQYSTQELLNIFYDSETIYLEAGKKYSKSIEFDLLPGQRSTRDIKIGNEVIVRKNRKFTRAAIRKLREANLDRLPIDPTELVGKISAEDVINEETGEVLLSVNEELSLDKLEELRKAKVEQIKVLFIDGLNVGSYLRDTLVADKIKTEEEAILEIYRRLRPGDPPTLDTARTLLNNLFFNPERYDLSKVGRLKLNYKFYKEDKDKVPLEVQVLTKQDIVETVRHLIHLKNTRGTVDDIDHLGNRRVRAVGELMENQYRIGLVRMERAIKERMSMSQELETLMPHDLINAKPVSAVVKEYFGSSQLSQFMDQTNPLVRGDAQAASVGARAGRSDARARGLRGARRSRHALRPHLPDRDAGRSEHRSDRVAVDVRARQRVRLRRDAVPARRLAAASPTRCAGTARSKKRTTTSRRRTPRWTTRATLTDSLVSARYNGEFVMVPPDTITLMDVSPNQLVSVAASLIPFLEHDDANRALMGSNMQRQAVPLVRPSAPIVGTGLEMRVARDSGVCITARRDGVVESVEATRVVVRRPHDDNPIPDIHRLTKFQRSNQGTCYNQKPGRAARRPGQEGRRARRRSRRRARRPGARPERGRRVHAVGRVQLRRLDPDQRARDSRRRVHLDPHRGVRVRRARHEARQGRDHARHPERRRGIAEGHRRVRHRAHRRRGQPRRRAGRQDHAEGRDPADAGREAAARDLRREGRRRARQLAARAAGRVAAS